SRRPPAALASACQRSETAIGREGAARACVELRAAGPARPGGKLARLIADPGTGHARHPGRGPALLDRGATRPDRRFIEVRPGAASRAPAQTGPARPGTTRLDRADQADVAAGRPGLPISYACPAVRLLMRLVFLTPLGALVGLGIVIPLAAAYVRERRSAS